MAPSVLARLTSLPGARRLSPGNAAGRNAPAQPSHVDRGGAQRQPPAAASRTAPRDRLAATAVAGQVPAACAIGAGRDQRRHDANGAGEDDPRSHQAEATGGRCDPSGAGERRQRRSRPAQRSVAPAAVGSDLAAGRTGLAGLDHGALHGHCRTHPRTCLRRIAPDSDARQGATTSAYPGRCAEKEQRRRPAEAGGTGSGPGPLGRPEDPPGRSRGPGPASRPAQPRRRRAQ